jgi:DNA transformation protein and related proteins
VTAEDLARLPGFGPASAQWLVDIGIESFDDIDRLGSVEVFRRLRASRPGVSINALWALECLVLGCHWRDLPADRKARLRADLTDGPAEHGQRGTST